MLIARTSFHAAIAIVITLALPGTARADGDAAAGKRVFAKCGACHTLEPGKHRIGPSLAGVLGRKAGTAEKYNYSKAMRSAGFTWDTAALDKYLTAPKKFVPGNKMPFPGLKKAEDRANVIAYLQAAAK